MKKIKLSGREVAVVRAVNMSIGTPGIEIFERTHIEIHELAEIITGLIEAGFLDCEPFTDIVTAESLPGATIGINPGYAHELKAALLRHI